MKCPNCGMELLTGEKFCRECGSKIEIPPQGYCSKCGAKLETTSKFCPECGAKINDDVEHRNNITKTEADNSYRKEAGDNKKINGSEKPDCKEDSAESKSSDEGACESEIYEDYTQKKKIMGIEVATLREKLEYACGNKKITVAIAAVLFALIVLVLIGGNKKNSTNADDNSALTSETKFEVVNVVEMAYPEAKEALKKAGFTNVSSNVEDGSDESTWIVVEQSIAEGKLINSDEKIVLTCAMKCKLYLDITSETNLFFSTYDITITLDDVEIGSVSNGNEFTYLADVLTGEHEIVFSKSGNVLPQATKNIVVSGDITYSCDLSHDSSSISMKNERTEDNINNAALTVVDVTGTILSEAMNTLENIGFSNLKGEPYGNIWDKDNWLVVTQSVSPGTIADKNVFIQLDCISLNDYFKNNYVGKNVCEIQELAEEKGFSLKFVDSSWSDISENIAAMDEETKEDWIATDARQYGAADKTAYVTVNYTGETLESTVTPTATPTAKPTVKPTATPKPTETANGANADANKTDEEDKVLTAENNADLAEILSSQYVDPKKQAEFIKKYKGQTIEFNCVVYYMTKNVDYKTIYSYVLIPGDDLEHASAAIFAVENVNWLDFKWDNETRPEYLTIGSLMKIRAKVITGDDELYIYLDPVKTWGR